MGLLIYKVFNIRFSIRCEMHTHTWYTKNKRRALNFSHSFCVTIGFLLNIHLQPMTIFPLWRSWTSHVWFFFKISNSSTIASIHLSFSWLAITFWKVEWSLKLIISTNVSKYSFSCLYSGLVERRFLSHTKIKSCIPLETSGMWSISISESGFSCGLGTAYILFTGGRSTSTLITYLLKVCPSYADTYVNIIFFRISYIELLHTFCLADEDTLLQIWIKFGSIFIEYMHIS